MKSDLIIKMDIEICQFEKKELELSCPRIRYRKLSDKLNQIQNERRSLLIRYSDSTRSDLSSLRFRLDQQVREIAQLRSSISSIDTTDQVSSIRLRKTDLRLKRLKADLMKEENEAVYFSGELQIREI